MLYNHVLIGSVDCKISFRINPQRKRHGIQGWVINTMLSKFIIYWDDKPSSTQNSVSCQRHTKYFQTLWKSMSLFLLLYFCWGVKGRLERLTLLLLKFRLSWFAFMFLGFYSYSAVGDWYGSTRKKTQTIKKNKPHTPVSLGCESPKDPYFFAFRALHSTRVWDVC